MKVKRGKEWVDEGPSSHHSVYSMTHGSGGANLGQAKPVLTPGAIYLTKARKTYKARKKAGLVEETKVREAVNRNFVGSKWGRKSEGRSNDHSRKKPN